MNNIEMQIPMLGVVTDIRRDTPDIKTFRVNTITGEGKVGMAGKGMGMHRSAAALIKLIQQHQIDERFTPLPIFTHTPENCFALVKKLGALGIACREEDASPVGATISTHVGPGVFGLVFAEKE